MDLSTLPFESIGVPLAGVIMYIVAQLKAANIINDDKAGIVACCLGIVAGITVLVFVDPQPVPLGRAIFEGILFGVITVSTHYSLVRPVVKASGG